MKKHTLKEGVMDITGYDSKKTEALILSGKVLVNERVVSKCGEKVPTDADIRIREINEYVSRGAYKLIKALDVFTPELDQKICVDAGSSTGGFTQILLLHGVQKVYAVDCGTNQLDYKLRIDPRVVSIEGRRIQDLAKIEFSPLPEFCVADISFTSCVPVVDHLFNHLEIPEGIILIKPQFEYQRLQKVLHLDDNFNGVVHIDIDREKIKSYICSELAGFGVTVAGLVQSPIKGMSGNIEYLSFIKRV